MDTAINHPVPDWVKPVWPGHL